MTTPQPREILSIEDLPENALVPEVAEFFRTTDIIVRRWIRDGAFPDAYLSGKSYRIPKKDVISYMKKQYGKR